MDSEHLLSVQRSIVDAIARNRGKKFRLRQALPVVEAVQRLRAMQNPAFDLHVSSVQAHYDALKRSCSAFAQRDEFLSASLQAPVAWDLLREWDAGFKRSVRRFADAIESAKPIIAAELRDVASDKCGIIAPLDVAPSPGSTCRMLMRIARRVAIPKRHAEAIIASKSFGMLTHYAFGDAFLAAQRKGEPFSAALSAEMEALQQMLLEPKALTARIAKRSSINAARYFERYGELAAGAMRNAFDAHVAYGNILAVASLPCADIGEHLGPTALKAFANDKYMALLEAVTDRASMAARSNPSLPPLRLLDALSVSNAAFFAALIEANGISASSLKHYYLSRHRKSIKNQRFNRMSEAHVMDFIRMLKAGKQHRRFASVAAYLPKKNLQKRKMTRSGENLSWTGTLPKFTFPEIAALPKFFCLLQLEPIANVLFTAAVQYEH